MLSAFRADAVPRILLLDHRENTSSNQAIMKEFYSRAPPIRFGPEIVSVTSLYRVKFRLQLR